MQSNTQLTDKSFTPPTPSRATRNVLRNSRASARGALLWANDNNQNSVVISFESGLEEQTLQLLWAHPAVVDVWDQPPPVVYFNARGKRLTHTFDFLVTLKSEQRIAIAVKPMARVICRRFVDKLKLIKKTLPNSFANDIALITERQIDKHKSLFAARCLEFSKVAEPEIDQALSNLLEKHREFTTVHDLVEALGLDGRGYRAIVRAIRNGLLHSVDGSRVDYDTKISMGGAS